MPEFMLDDGYTGVIRTIDLHNAAEEMARKLGIRGEIRTMVGKWEENGQLTGWTKKAKAGCADVLLEVFASRLDDESREFDRYARMYQALQDENAALRSAATLAHNVLTGLGSGTVEWAVVKEPVGQLRAALASVDRSPEGQDREDGLDRNDESAVGASRDAQNPVAQ